MDDHRDPVAPVLGLVDRVVIIVLALWVVDSSSSFNDSGSEPEPFVEPALPERQSMWLD